MAKLNKYLTAVTTATAALLLSAGIASAATLDFNGATPCVSTDAFVTLSTQGAATCSTTTAPTTLSQAICLNAVGVSCSNTSRGGVGDPTSDKGGLFFLSGAETFMNVAAGFDTGFSFNYTAPFQGGTINVFAGLGGTGALLGSIVLGLTTSGCGPEFGADFCPFKSAFIAFAGIAQSVSFGGVANQIVFDDVTFGSITPGEIPVPAALPLLLTAIGGLGVASRFRKNRATA